MCRSMTTPMAKSESLDRLRGEDLYRQEEGQIEGRESHGSFRGGIGPEEVPTQPPGRVLDTHTETIRPCRPRVEPKTVASNGGDEFRAHKATFQTLSVRPKTKRSSQLTVGVGNL